MEKNDCPIEERQLIIIAGTSNSPIAPRPIISRPLAWASLNTSSWPKTSAPSRCPYSTAVWLQFNSAEVVPLDELGPYVQDALDLIEFANGDAGSGWVKCGAAGTSGHRFI